MLRTMLVVLIVALLQPSGAGAIQSCVSRGFARADEVEILSFQGHPGSSGLAEVVGEVAYWGSEPAEVRLQAVLRDGAGAVSATERFAARSGPMLPGERVAFSQIILARGEVASTELQVYEIR